MKELKRGLKAFLLALLAYLFQVCVMQHLSILGMSASLLFTVLAILTVSYGKKYAFCAACIIGMLMESMLANVPAMYVIAYPVITMLCAQKFADMTDRQRERRRMLTQGRRRMREGDLPAHLRILLCACLMDLILNVAFCIYFYLIGVDISLYHIGKIIGNSLYTGVLTLLLMVPIRYFLGMYPRRKKEEQEGDLL